MKKALLNTLAILLIIYHGYLIANYIPRMIESYNSTDSSAISYNVIFSVSIALLIIVGVSLFFRKNWSIILYWISIIVLLVLIILGDAYIPLINNYLFIFLNVIVAAFLTTQWGKLKK